MPRKLLFTFAVSGALMSAAGLAQAGQLTAKDPGQPVQKKVIKPVPQPHQGCGSFGTAVEFVATPSDAARQAKKEQKLVLVLHVSGHFEDPRFT